MIYRTLPEKWDAVVEEIKELHEKGQPVLVGTVSVENSELIADRLKAHRRAAQRPQRQVSRARSRDRRPGRPQRRGHDRHQHGRPRHRHPARRQSRFPGPRVSESGRRSIPTKRPRSSWRKQLATGKAHRRSGTQGSRRPRRTAHPRHRTPRIAPHRQSASRTCRPPGRSGIVAFLPFARRRSDAHLRRRQGQGR